MGVLFRQMEIMAEAFGALPMALMAGRFGALPRAPVAGRPTVKPWAPMALALSVMPRAPMALALPVCHGSQWQGYLGLATNTGDMAKLLEAVAVPRVISGPGRLSAVPANWGYDQLGALFHAKGTSGLGVYGTPTILGM